MNYIYPDGNEYVILILLIPIITISGYLSLELINFLSTQAILLLFWEAENPWFFGLIAATMILLYYIPLTLIIILLINSAFISIPMNLDITVIILLSTVIAYIPRMSYLTHDYNYSRKVLISILTPLTITNIITILAFSNNPFQMEILLNIDWWGYIGFIVIIFIFGDGLLFLFKKSGLIDIDLVLSNTKIMKLQASKQNIVIISPLFTKWKKGTGDERLKAEEAINYVYQVAVADQKIPGTNGYFMRSQMRELLKAKLEENRKDLSMKLEAILFKLSVYDINHGDLLKIHDFYQSFKLQLMHPHHDFEKELLIVCLEDIRDNINNANIIARRIVISLQENMNQSLPHLKNEDRTLFHKVIELGKKIH